MIAYKVVSESPGQPGWYLSAIVRGNECCGYIPGLKTSIGGKLKALLAFDTLENAKEFIQCNLGTNVTPMHLFEAEVVTTENKKLIPKRYYVNKYSNQLDEKSYKYFHKGTVFCKSIILLEELPIE